MPNDSRNIDIEISRADPVCGKDVPSQEALIKELFYIYEHKEYIFCSGCLKKIQKAPQQYVSEEIPHEVVDTCEVCHKKIYKGEDFSTVMMNGMVHKFCRPVCAVVFEILNEVIKLPVPELQKH